MVWSRAVQNFCCKTSEPNQRLRFPRNSKNFGLGAWCRKFVLWESGCREKTGSHKTSGHVQQLKPTTALLKAGDFYQLVKVEVEPFCKCSWNRGLEATFWGKEFIFLGAKPSPQCHIWLANAKKGLVLSRALCDKGQYWVCSQEPWVFLALSAEHSSICKVTSNQEWRHQTAIGVLVWAKIHVVITWLLKRQLI